MNNFLLLICSLFLLIPTNRYLWKAIRHRQPKINTYEVFESRHVEANDPKPWKEASAYNTLHIPEKYMKSFNDSKTVAFVVIHNNQLLFEEYWDEYNAKTRSNPFSATKSLTSLAIGKAIDDGLIKSVDQPVSDFFPQFKGYNGKTLTIRHLLTMSAGMDSKEQGNAFTNAETKLYYGSNLMDVINDMDEAIEPGTKFIYQNRVTQLLGFILKKVTGKDVSTYVSEHFWTPIQAEEDALWSLDKKNGMEKTFCCFNTTARDMARLGQLVLNGGTWNGKRLISEDYLKAAVIPDTTIMKGTDKRNYDYGYQFWITTFNEEKLPTMSGMYGQKVYVMPSQNAVIVRFGHTDLDDKVALQAAMDILNSEGKK